MNHQARATGNLERRIHDAERNLFAAVGDEFFLELAPAGLRVRVLSHGRGPTVVLLHGVSESSAIWAPLFTKLRHFRLLAVDLPGHGLSDPIAFRRGQVREHARRLIEPRECSHERRARRDHDTHDLHPRIRRPVPLHRARTVVDRPDSRRQAL
jgi:pimeloyl-ACP methyl ester carboxylesterase